jgi:hypothetical protein
MVTKLHEGDPRCEALLQALKKEIYARCQGMPVPSIIGTLEILKLDILEEQK